MILNKYKLQLVKEQGRNYPQYDREMTAPDKIASLLIEIGVDKEPTESFYMILCDTRFKITGITKLATGTLDMAIVDTRSMMQAALLGNAAAIIIAHNHPSGDSRPSRADIASTERVEQAAQLLGIRLLDHIIIGHDGDYSSLKELGY